MKLRHMALAILALMGVLTNINAVLGNFVASLLQGKLGDHAWLIVMPFIVIAAVLLGFGLRDQVQALLQDRRPAFDRRNRQAMLAKVRTCITESLWDPLYEEVLITLDLMKRPKAVVPPHRRSGAAPKWCRSAAVAGDQDP